MDGPRETMIAFDGLTAFLRFRPDLLVIKIACLLVKRTSDKNLVAGGGELRTCSDQLVAEVGGGQMGQCHLRTRDRSGRRPPGRILRADQYGGRDSVIGEEKEIVELFH